MIRSYLFCSILEYGVVQSEKLFYDAKTYVQIVVDVVCNWISFHCWCHAPVVIIVSRFIVGY